MKIILILSTFNFLAVTFSLPTPYAQQVNNVISKNSKTTNDGKAERGIPNFFITNDPDSNDLVDITGESEENETRDEVLRISDLELKQLKSNVTAAVFESIKFVLDGQQFNATIKKNQNNNSGVEYLKTAIETALNKVIKFVDVKEDQNNKVVESAKNREDGNENVTAKDTETSEENEDNSIGLLSLSNNQAESNIETVLSNVDSNEETLENNSIADNSFNNPEIITVSLSNNILNSDSRMQVDNLRAKGGDGNQVYTDQTEFATNKVIKLSSSHDGSAHDVEFIESSTLPFNFNDNENFHLNADGIEAAVEPIELTDKITESQIDQSMKNTNIRKKNKVTKMEGEILRSNDTETTNFVNKNHNEVVQNFREVTTSNRKMQAIFGKLNPEFSLQHLLNEPDEDFEVATERDSNQVNRRKQESDFDKSQESLADQTSVMATLHFVTRVESTTLPMETSPKEESQNESKNNSESTLMSDTVSNEIQDPASSAKNHAQFIGQEEQIKLAETNDSQKRNTIPSNNDSVSNLSAAPSEIDLSEEMHDVFISLLEGLGANDPASELFLNDTSTNSGADVAAEFLENSTLSDDLINKEETLDNRDGTFGDVKLDDFGDDNLELTTVDPTQYINTAENVSDDNEKFKGISNNPKAGDIKSASNSNLEKNAEEDELLKGSELQQVINKKNEMLEDNHEINSDLISDEEIASSSALHSLKDSNDEDEINDVENNNNEENIYMQSHFENATNREGLSSNIATTEAGIGSEHDVTEDAISEEINLVQNGGTPSEEENYVTENSIPQIRMLPTGFNDEEELHSAPDAQVLNYSTEEIYGVEFSTPQTQNDEDKYNNDNKLQKKKKSVQEIVNDKQEYLTEHGGTLEPKINQFDKSEEVTSDNKHTIMEINRTHGNSLSHETAKVKDDFQESATEETTETGEIDDSIKKKSKITGDDSESFAVEAKLLPGSADVIFNEVNIGINSLMSDDVNNIELMQTKSEKNSEITNRKTQEIIADNSVGNINNADNGENVDQDISKTENRFESNGDQTKLSSIKDDTDKEIDFAKDTKAMEDLDGTTAKPLAESNNKSLLTTKLRSHEEIQNSVESENENSKTTSEIQLKYSNEKINGKSEAIFNQHGNKLEKVNGHAYVSENLEVRKNDEPRENERDEANKLSDTEEDSQLRSENQISMNDAEETAYLNEKRSELSDSEVTENISDVKKQKGNASRVADTKGETLKSVKNKMKHNNDDETSDSSTNLTEPNETDNTIYNADLMSALLDIFNTVLAEHKITLDDVFPSKDSKQNEYINTPQVENQNKKPTIKPNSSNLKYTNKGALKFEKAAEQTGYLRPKIIPKRIHPVEKVTTHGTKNKPALTEGVESSTKLERSESDDKKNTDDKEEMQEIMEFESTRIKNDKPTIKTSDKENFVPIVKQLRTLNSNGEYSFMYESADGTYRSETGKKLENYDGVLSQEGEYSFLFPSGERFSLKYIADEAGFQPESDYIPRSTRHFQTQNPKVGRRKHRRRNSNKRS